MEETESVQTQGVVKEDHCIPRTIHHLPLELLMKIFALTLEAHILEFRWEGSRRRAPSSLDQSTHPNWALSQVCRLWREITLNMPSLWSFITLAFPSSEDSPTSAKLQKYLLDLQLERVANHPIDIIAATPDPFSSRIKRPLLQLCSRSPIWRRICIELWGDLFWLWGVSIQGRLQSLESLDLKFILPITRDVYCFQSAPQLKNLAFSAGELALQQLWHPNKLKLPYSQITHFCWKDETETKSESMDNQGLSILFSHRALLLLQNLKYCRLELRGETLYQYRLIQARDAFVMNQLRVSFQHLAELELGGVDVQNGADAILDFLEVSSSLERLNIFSSGLDRTALSNFITHPKNLLCLRIPNVEMLSNEFSIILRSLTSLTDLTFGVRGGITDDYLSLFLPDELNGDGFAAVPHLQNLSLLPVPHFTSTYSTDILLDVLESRRESSPTGNSFESSPSSCSRLLSVNLDKQLDTPPALQRLSQLQIEGLRVGLSWEK
ncbi:hypothetical protein PM082_014613 [Marasmius tenuissimus]|nr:hypothetical protein PM082_014613 [Marasmius tenuissimus]